MKSLDKFEEIVDHIYGMYLHSSSGLVYLLKNFTQTQASTIQSMKITHPELANLDHLDSTAMIYGKGDPNNTSAVELHRCTQGEFKARNAKTGINQKFLGNMALVTIYQYWEDFHRNDIATEFGIEKNDLKSPIMGDLRLIRISILHHAGIALKQIEKCEILKFFKENDDIFIDEDMFQEIVLQIKQWLNAIKLNGLQSEA